MNFSIWHTALSTSLCWHTYPRNASPQRLSNMLHFLNQCLLFYILDLCNFVEKDVWFASNNKREIPAGRSNLLPWSPPYALVPGLENTALIRGCLCDETSGIHRLLNRITWRATFDYSLHYARSQHLDRIKPTLDYFLVIMRGSCRLGWMNPSFQIQI